MATSAEIQAQLDRNAAQRESLAAKLGPATDAAQQAYNTASFFNPAGKSFSDSWSGSFNGQVFSDPNALYAAAQADFTAKAAYRKQLAEEFNALFPIKTDLEKQLAVAQSSEASEAQATKTVRETVGGDAPETTGAAAAVSTDGVKPDGTPVDGTAQPTNITKGAAITQQAADVAAQGNVSKAAAADAATVLVNKAVASNIQRGLPNVLDEFATYNSLFTFACLKPQEANNPYLYRNSAWSSKQVVFASAGRFDAERAGTAYGSPEYYVQSFSMQSIITGTETAGTTNSISFNFTIWEPYSMGLFLQSLEVAAEAAGYDNYLTNAIYVLKLEFMGFDDKGTPAWVPYPKYFTVQLKKTTFTVNEGGSTYTFEAIPFNLNGFSKVNNAINQDISITGETVKELLTTGERSLQTVLNEKEERAARPGSNQGKSIPDKYEIHFPETSDTPIPGVTPDAGTNTATVNQSNQVVVTKSASNALNSEEFGDNPIGSAIFDFQTDSGGNYVAPKASDVHDEGTGKVNRDKVTNDSKKRTFQYGKDQTVVQIITQAIEESDYARKALQEEYLDKGRINWFRVDVQIQLLDWDETRKDYAKRVIFRVLPYKIHSSVFTNPNAVPTGYDELEGDIIKQYNYIYTGSNNDLLKFDIQINNSFFTAISPTPPDKAGRIQNNDQASSGIQDNNGVEVQEGANTSDGLGASSGGRTVKPDSSMAKLPFGGSGNLTPEQFVANNFHQAFLQTASTEMVKINAEIMGDPYWLVDSGMGGYFASTGVTDQITADNSCNYEAGDTYIYIRFRTPIEPKESAGDYLFVDSSDSPFSGIYKVIKVESKFSDGTFKQTLDCVRMPMQANDFRGKVVPKKAGSLMYKQTKPIKPSAVPWEEDTAYAGEDEPGSGDPEQSQYA